MSEAENFSASSRAARAKRGWPEGTGAISQPGKFKLYQVRKGDTLRALAERFYGHAEDWKRINDANLHKLENPDRIYVGQLLRIPLDEKDPATTKPAP